MRAMPSDARRRKAALKKKKKMQRAMDEGVDVPVGDSEVFEAGGGLQEGEDLKTQEDRDSDSSGETWSPASQDQHCPFEQGVEESEKGDSVEGADGDDCVVELEIKDGSDDKECGETGIDADEGCRSPVKEGVKVLDETALLSVQCDLQEFPDEEINGNACSDYPRNPREGDTDGGVKKVYPGPEESDSQHPLGKDNRGFDDLSSPLQDKTVEVDNGDAIDAHQSVLLPDGPIKIVSATEEEDSEEKVIDGEGSRLAVESDNFEDEVKDLIAGTTLPYELADPVNWLPEATSLEAAPLTSTTDPASLLQNDDVSGASSFKEPDDSISSPEEPKERILSAIRPISGVDIPNLTLNDAGDKLLPIGVDKTGTPEDGLESFLEDNDGEQMPSSGFLIAKVDNGAEKCNVATLADNGPGSVLKENGVAKLEDAPDKSNLATNGNEAFLKENGRGDESILGVVIAQNGHCKEKSNDLEDAHNNIDDQHELPKVPRVVRKTSWTGCCGLFDVITGKKVHRC